MSASEDQVFGGSRQALDMKAMVANFTNGDTLRKLQQELQQSNQSMQQSLAFTRQAMDEANYMG